MAPACNNLAPPPPKKTSMKWALFYRTQPPCACGLEENASRDIRERASLLASRTANFPEAAILGRVGNPVELTPTAIVGLRADNPFGGCAECADDGRKIFGCLFPHKSG